MDIPTVKMDTFILGIAAGTLCTLSFLPQVIQITRSKETKNISLATFVLFSAGVFLWFVYGIRLRELPIIIANGFTLTLALFIVLMKLRHG